MSNINNEVISFLRKFNDMNELVEECKTRGVKGRPGSQCHCIVAQLIVNEFPSVVTVIVHPGNNFPNEGTAPGFMYIDGEDSCDLPLLLSAFANRFDLRHFPQLEAA